MKRPKSPNGAIHHNMGHSEATPYEVTHHNLGQSRSLVRGTRPMDGAVAPQLRVFLVDIVDKTTTPEILADRMKELESLVQTYGGIVILQQYQKKDTPDPKTYVGKGKLDEIIQEMLKLQANLLIVGNALKPAQIYQINEKLRLVSEENGLKEKMQARDRIDLILKIFEKHATSGESRLQIELAAIKHMGPRIYGMGMELSKQGGSASSG